MSGMTTRSIPACASALAQPAHGSIPTFKYAVAPASLMPWRAALNTALASAWQIQVYFAGRSHRDAMVSSTPRANPLNPTDSITLPSPTMTQPTLVDGSLDFEAT